MSFTMQRYLQGWTVSPPPQAPSYQGPNFYEGYVSKIAQMGDVTRTQSHAQMQQTVLEMMTRGQIGARNLSHLTNHGLPQPMAQMARAIPQEIPSDFRTSILAGANLQVQTHHHWTRVP